MNSWLSQENWREGKRRQLRTWVTNSISYDDNRSAKHASKKKLGMYLSVLSAIDKMWQKGNFYVMYCWFEFRIFLLDWLLY